MIVVHNHHYTAALVGTAQTKFYNLIYHCNIYFNYIISDIIV